MPEWLDALRSAFQQNAAIGWSLAGFSLVALVGSVLALPWFVAALPANYFSANPQKRNIRDYLNLRAIAVLAAKNVLGLVLVLAGLAMLVLPGQGLLTLFAGLVLCDFPGKHALTLKVVQQPAVLRTLNRMRRARNKEAFILEENAAASGD